MYEVLSDEEFTQKVGYEFINDILCNNYRPSLKILDDNPQL